MTIRRGHCFVFYLILAILIATVCSSANIVHAETIVLNVYGSVTNGNWVRDPSTDLPDYNSTVSYSVSNSGNLDATNVSISISIDGNPYWIYDIPLIAMYSAYSSSFLYSTPYNQTRNVFIVASCQSSSNSCSLTVGSTFPTNWSNGRNLDPTVELFVTPNEQSVSALKEYILSIKSPFDPVWTALWSWVGLHITYSQGSYYHWQFPWETIQSGEGMCVDYSTLLVSLYRDGVFGPNDAYVVCGLNAQGEGHAWVIVRLSLLGISTWYTLDPQENGGFLLNLLVNPFQVSGYTALYEFNDQQFITLVNPLSATISPNSSILNVGQSQMFNSSVFGGVSPYTYQWAVNGIWVSGAASSTWTFTPTSAGSYTVYVVVTDSVGMQATSFASTVTVNNNRGFHNVTITNARCFKTLVGLGYNVSMSLTVADLGNYMETFNVMVFADNTFVGFSSVTNLPAGMSIVLNFSCNTAGFEYGNITLRAFVDTSMASNNYTGGQITITIPGDLTGDLRVNLLDLVLLANAFGSRPGDSNWNPNADINGNGAVDLPDLVILANHYGQHYP